MQGRPDNSTDPPTPGTSRGAKGPGHRGSRHRLTSARPSARRPARRSLLAQVPARRGGWRRRGRRPKRRCWRGAMGDGRVGRGRRRAFRTKQPEVGAIAEHLGVRINRIACHVRPLERAGRVLRASEATGQLQPQLVLRARGKRRHHESHSLRFADVRIAAIAAAIAAGPRRRPDLRGLLLQLCARAIAPHARGGAHVIAWVIHSRAHAVAIALPRVGGVELQQVAVETLLGHAVPALPPPSLAAQTEFHPAVVVHREGQRYLKRSVRGVHFNGVEGLGQSLLHARSPSAIGGVGIREGPALGQVPADAHARLRPQVLVRLGGRNHLLFAIGARRRWRREVAGAAVPAAQVTEGARAALAAVHVHAVRLGDIALPPARVRQAHVEQHVPRRGPREHAVPRRGRRQRRQERRREAHHRGAMSTQTLCLRRT
mmetsp:Transcript_67338/g.206230  ORF Transcript_67338/g.206230 Transcript_67338/m.206230 type:complete len:430 (+) Transcript_67338:258-1547(+)